MPYVYHNSNQMFYSYVNSYLQVTQFSCCGETFTACIFLRIESIEGKGTSWKFLYHLNAQEFKIPPSKTALALMRALSRVLKTQMSAFLANTDVSSLPVIVSMGCFVYFACMQRSVEKVWRRRKSRKKETVDGKIAQASSSGPLSL